MLRKYNHAIPFSRAQKVYTYAQLMRFIPGKIWHLLSRTVLAKKENIPVVVVSATLVLEILFMVLSGTSVFLVTLLFTRDLTKDIWIYPLLALIPITLIIIYPPFFNRVFKIAAKIIGQESPDLKISMIANLNLFVLYIFSWLASGASIYFLIASFLKIDASNLPAIIGIIAISWVIGFFSIITPSGLGVREATITAMLTSIIPAYFAAVASIIIRIFDTLIEVVFAGWAWLLDKFVNNRR